MSSDAITLLKADHREIRRLFREYRRAGSRAVKTKARLVDQIIELLTVHTYIENEVMYPQVRELLPKLKDDVLESYEEHHVADLLCAELAGLTPADERFEPKTTVLIENVTHHIEEEESDWFPKVRSGLGRKQLREKEPSLRRPGSGHPGTQPSRAPPRRPSTPSCPDGVSPCLQDQDL